MSTEKFRDYLWGSQVAVSLVAAYFIRAGMDVKVDGYNDQQPDDGDIYVKRVGEAGWRYVEVKSRKDCTSDQLLSFPHIYIDKKTTYDKKTNIPDFYYIVGTDHDYALLWNADDIGQCTVETFKDAVTGNMEKCYAIHPDKLKKVRIGICRNT